MLLLYLIGTKQNDKMIELLVDCLKQKYDKPIMIKIGHFRPITNGDGNRFLSIDIHYI